MVVSSLCDPKIGARTVAQRSKAHHVLNVETGLDSRRRTVVADDSGLLTLVLGSKQRVKLFQITLQRKKMKEKDNKRERKRERTKRKKEKREKEKRIQETEGAKRDARTNKNKNKQKTTKQKTSFT